ncbi:hypothetical protein A11A3_04415 [Alcanivorax hongdengensis A-11-3]|uniref:Uncharacterized protein n=1 Tax=Alcanivorax hongdengensis A-11-3 TaxID=1177179 RepID=L0WED1_9GAMM|nr:hypothetical protein [Alcanivorax hongdengensis]EKF75193.1 hypothetical protein A11A3_04415 [Alcanivorax hongdengensis A-11-3]
MNLRQIDIYPWLCQHLQHDEPLSGQPNADLDSLRPVLRPCDVLLVSGHSRVDRTFKAISDSRFARAVLYIGRLHDVADPTLRALLADYTPCEPDTQLVIDTRLERGLTVQPLTTLEGRQLRVCRPQGLSEQETQDVLRFAISRIGGASVRSWPALFMLTLMPWRWLTPRWRSRLFRRWAGDVLKALSGTLAGDAFSFVQFPVLPLVKENGTPPRLLRLQPRAFIAADFDHSPYFEIIKAPFQMRAVPAGMDTLPWKGNQSALAPERQRHLSLVDTAQDKH